MNMENYKNEENIEENKPQDDDSISNVNIEKYKDLDGLSLKKLNFGLWYLEHKDLLRISIYVFLGLIAFITWSIFFKTFGYYVLVGMREDQALINEMVNNPGILHEQVLKTAAHPIQVKSANVILNSNGNYDIVTKISNVNKKYFSRFVYYFNAGNEKIGPFEDFILPNEEKYLILNNHEFSRRPGSVKLDISNSWNKIDGHKIKDWNIYRDNYIDFDISNKKFSNPRESSLSEKLNLSVVEFDIKNNSAYSYYSVELDVLLYSRGKLVAVNKYPLERFDSGENRHINMTWSGKVNRADTIEIVPNIDILERDIMYIP